MYHGFMYHKNKAPKNRIYWRCANNFCSSTLHTNVFLIETNARFDVVKEPTCHNHRAPTDYVERLRLLNDMRRIVVADPCAPVRGAYENVMDASQARRIAVDLQPTFLSLESSLRRARLSQFPPIPKDIDDVRIAGEWALNSKDKRFLLACDNAWGLSVFATDKSISILKSCDTIFVDGTFKTAPLPYHQMITVHGLYMGAVVPLCFCLCTGKSVAQYREMLRIIKSKVRALTRRNWQPNMAVCDFELSLMSALETEFPGISVRACYFHLCQSIWRKVQSLGLSRAWRRTGSRAERLRKFIHKIMALGHVPLPLVRNAFNAYCASRSVIRLARHFPALVRFIAYMRRMYVERNAVFPPRVWNAFDRSTDCRTNNNVES